MALYERIVGRNDAGVKVDGKLPVHQLQAVFAEFARGILTSTDAQTIITQFSAVPLSAGEITELQTLLASITGSLANKLIRVKILEDVFMLAERRSPGYAQPTQVKTRIGV